MIRNESFKKIDYLFKVNPIVALLGPRQCGKTTIAKSFFGKNSKALQQNYFDLENVFDLGRLENPQSALSNLTGLIVIDEVQHRPDLFKTLRVLVDRPKNRQKFLILGSASPELLRQSSETLTGRISYLELTPFNFCETEKLDRLWVRGGFPKSFLAKNDDASLQWRSDYVRTFLERDIPNFGIRIPAKNLQRFWMMLTYFHGNVLNASSLGHSLDLSYKTIKDYCDILSETMMIRQLQPWFENISKRQVKSPKIYFRDSGILHHHLGLKNKNDLMLHPKLGASWEGFALEEIIRAFGATQHECYFWATHNDAELDLMIVRGEKRFGFEIKFSRTPRMTRSMHVALNDLRLDKLFVIYPDARSFPLQEKVMVYGIEEFLNAVWKKKIKL